MEVVLRVLFVMIIVIITMTSIVMIIKPFLLDIFPLTNAAQPVTFSLTNAVAFSPSTLTIAVAVSLAFAIASSFILLKI